MVPPKCPIHKTNMKLRIAKEGKYEGQIFYVCPIYPDCKMHIKYEDYLRVIYPLKTNLDPKDENITIQKETEDKKAIEKAKREKTLEKVLRKIEIKEELRAAKKKKDYKIETEKFHRTSGKKALIDRLDEMFRNSRTIEIETRKLTTTELANLKEQKEALIRRKRITFK